MTGAFDSVFSGEERVPIFPVFLLVDTSTSMGASSSEAERPPIEAVNDAMPELKRLFADEPLVEEVARVGVISFADKARTELPLSDLKFVEIPRLSAGGMTNFAAAFRTAKTELENSIRALGTGTPFREPVIYFMSDGEHTASEDWEQPLRALIDKSFKYRPHIVTFGFGDANHGVMRQIARKHAFMAKAKDPTAATKEIMKSIMGSIRETSRSLAQDQKPRMEVRVDEEQFEVLETRTV